MELTIKTSPKALEAANCILGQAIKVLLESEQQRKNLDVSITNVKDAEKFRKAVLKQLFKQR